MTLLAQISDPHARLDDERGQARLRAVAAHLDSLDGLACVLVTGDVTQSGLPEELALFRELAPRRHPLVLLPGNHDGRGDVMSDEAMAPAVHDLGDADLVTLDSTFPGFDDGQLGLEQLDWLDGVLAGSTRPVVLALHHPPVRLHMMADTWPLHDAGTLREVVARHACVAGVLAGHAHTTGFATLAGRPVVCCPSLKNASLLPVEGNGVVRHDPPAFALHTLADGVLTTHVRTVPGA